MCLWEVVELTSYNSRYNAPLHYRRLDLQPANWRCANVLENWIAHLYSLQVRALQDLARKALHPP